MHIEHEAKFVKSASCRLLLAKDFDNLAQHCRMFDTPVAPIWRGTIFSVE